MRKTKVAIIGSGPAGYTAGIYTGRARLEPVLYAGAKSGGQLMFTTDIENFPGFAAGKNGPELMFEMRAQAEKFGAEIHDEYVMAVDFSARPFKLWTHLPAGAVGDELETATPQKVAELIAAVKQEPHDLETEAIIIAVGAKSKMLGVPGEMEFFGKGVSTCAVCDAAFYKDKSAIVVGGGDTAMEDALALTKFASSVTLLVRGDKLRASKVMQERVLGNAKITVKYNTQIASIHGTQFVEKVTLKSTTDGSETEQAIDGVFLAIGHTPMTAIFKDQLPLDDKGYIVTRHAVNAAGLELAKAALNQEGMVKFPSMTAVEGVFAAGDVVDVRYWQAITAAAQGCQAAIDAERWLEISV